MKIVLVHAWNKEMEKKNPRRIAIIVCVEAPLSDEEREEKRARVSGEGESRYGLTKKKVDKAQFSLYL